MSHISIHRLDEIARKRIGRIAQVAALPPQPARLDAEFWALTRRPFAHARNTRMMSFAVGKDTPAVAKLQADIRVQAFITAEFPDFNLEQFLISPELPSEIIDSINTYSALIDPNQLTAEQLAIYKPTGLSTTLTLNSPDIELPVDGANYVFSGPAQPAPCIIRSVSIGNPGFNAEMTWAYIVDGLGTVLAGRGMSQAGAMNIGTDGAGLNLWVLSGAVQPRLELYNAVTSAGIDAAQLHVTVELLQRV